MDFAVFCQISENLSYFYTHENKYKQNLCSGIFTTILDLNRIILLFNTLDYEKRRITLIQLVHVSNFAKICFPHNYQTRHIHNISGNRENKSMQILVSAKIDLFKVLLLQIQKHIQNSLEKLR